MNSGLCVWGRGKMGELGKVQAKWDIVVGALELAKYDVFITVYMSLLTL